MLTRIIRIQLVLFTMLTVISLVVLGWYYLRLPDAGRCRADTRCTPSCPPRAGCTRLSNVTYRGVTIGMVTGVEPTERGVQATLSIDNRFKIPVDAWANVHSVSAVGEQYIDLVSEGIRTSTSPRPDHHEIHCAQPDRADAGCVNRGLRCCPRTKIASLLDETVAGGWWTGTNAAPPGRLDPGLRRRLQREHHRDQRHHRQLGADHRQPSQFRRLDQALGGGPEHHLGPGSGERPQLRGAPVQCGAHRRPASPRC